MEWISVQDHLPPIGEVILCCDMLNEFVSLGRMTLEDNGEFGCFELMWIDEVQLDAHVTHWMLRPEPYKEKNALD